MALSLTMTLGLVFTDSHTFCIDSFLPSLPSSSSFCCWAAHATPAGWQSTHTDVHVGGVAPPDGISSRQIVPAARGRHQRGTCHVQILLDTVYFHTEVLVKLGQCWQLWNWTWRCLRENFHKSSRHSQLITPRHWGSFGKGTQRRCLSLRPMYTSSW